MGRTRICASSKITKQILTFINNIISSNNNINQPHKAKGQAKILIPTRTSFKLLENHNKNSHLFYLSVDSDQTVKEYLLLVLMTL